MAYTYWRKKPYCVHAKKHLYLNKGVLPFPIVQRQLPITLIGQLIRKIEGLGPAIDSMRTPVSTMASFRRNALQIELLEDATTAVTATEASSSSSSLKTGRKSFTHAYETDLEASESHCTITHERDVDCFLLKKKLAVMFYLVPDSSALLTTNIIFSLIHVSAWQFHFPTDVERRLWHIFIRCVQLR